MIEVGGPTLGHLSLWRVAGRAAGLGLASGGRSTAGLAAVAARTPAGTGAGRQPLTALTGPAASRVGAMLVLGELVADKLPSTPSRLDPRVLPARVLAGGLASWLLAQRDAVAPALPVAAGAAAAVLGSILGLSWRRAAVRWGLARGTAAVLEDAVVLGVAAAAARPAR